MRSAAELEFLIFSLTPDPSPEPERGDAEIDYQIGSKIGVFDIFPHP
jgi:hypothetical protein